MQNEVFRYTLIILVNYKLTRNPNKWVGNQDFFFSKSKSGHYKMSTLHFSSDIGLGPGPLADP